jgi:hypothetical protein
MIQEKVDILLLRLKSDLIVFMHIIKIVLNLYLLQIKILCIY